MKVFVFIALLSVVTADGYSKYHPKINSVASAIRRNPRPASFRPSRANTGPHYGPSYKGYYDSPKPYQFAYAVDDPVSGAVFSQNEKSDGKTTKGYYSVNLPDGRIQHVDYIADDRSGYNADVTYTGKAQYQVGKRGYGPAGAGYYPGKGYKRPHRYHSYDDKPYHHH